MKHNLSKSLMTSYLSSFRAIATIALTTSTLAMQPAFAESMEIVEHNNRGNMLLSRRLFQDAINEYETILKIDPNHRIGRENLALAHDQWGIYYFRLRKYQEAKEQWETALKINPANRSAQQNMRRLEYTLKNMPPVPAAAGTPAAPPKPAGPQDWSPFDESLDKPQVKINPTTSAAASTPAVTTLPAASSNQGASGASIAGGGVTGPSVSATTGGSGASIVSGTSGASLVSGTSGASIVSGGSGASVVAGENSGASIVSSSSSGASIVQGNGAENPIGNDSSGNNYGPTISAGHAGTSDSSDPFSSGAPSGPSLVKNGSAPGSIGVAVLDTPPEPTPGGIRIVGGNSGSASIIVGGAPSSSSAAVDPGTINGGTRSANVFPSPGAPRNTVVPNTGGAPVRFPPRAASGSVPMSWPGGGESAPQSPAASQNIVSAKTTPSFLAKPEDNQATEDADKEDQSGSSSNVEDVLAKMENKVYGKVSKNMPIIKRIERLEVDTNGKKRSGTIAERLKELKKTYGF